MTTLSQKSNPSLKNKELFAIIRWLSLSLIRMIPEKFARPELQKFLEVFLEDSKPLKERERENGKETIQKTKGTKKIKMED